MQHKTPRVTYHVHRAIEIELANKLGPDGKPLSHLLPALGELLSTPAGVSAIKRGLKIAKSYDSNLAGRVRRFYESHNVVYFRREIFRNGKSKGPIVWAGVVGDPTLKTFYSHYVETLPPEIQRSKLDEMSRSELAQYLTAYFKLGPDDLTASNLQRIISRLNRRLDSDK